MDESQNTSLSSFRAERYPLAVLAAWTLVVASSLTWNALHVNRDTLELARLQARVGHEKDVFYRRWNMTRGPVYVAESEEAPPNPYLAQEPDRDITTPSGKRLTMVNPAYMTRQVHEMTEKESGVLGHITSLKPIRRENAADAWETEALKRAERGQAEVSDVQSIGGREYMRLLKPLITERGCLKCHAEQGYREGDIRGGISVSVPMDPSRAVERRYITALTVGHVLIWIVGAAGIVVGGRRLRASRDAIELKNTQLAQRGRELREAFRALDLELESVADVQISLLPARVPDIPGFETVTHYKPAKRAGGDYYDFFPLPDGQWGVLIADASGHGAPAAVVMAMTHIMLHVAAKKFPPAYVLECLNRALVTNIPSGQFVTACYGVLDPNTRTIRIASAGHPPPLFFEQSTGRSMVRAIETGLPLGIVAGAEYGTSSIKFEPGSVMLLYTDGVTDAFDGEDQQFGLARLMNALDAHGKDRGEGVLDGILTALSGHRGHVELADDITLVVLRALEHE